MQVKIEDTGKLRRKLNIEIPQAEVAAAYDTFYGEVKNSIRMDGFRPGKIPKALAEKRFQSAMKQEASRQLVPKYLDEALKQHNLRPATQPHLHLEEVDKDKPLVFNAEFEIFPEFNLKPLSTFKIKTQEVKVEKKQIEQRIEDLRKSRATPEDKGNAPAAKGDIVHFDFNATHEDKPVPGVSGQNQTLEIGAGRFLEAFEDKLPGCAVGQEHKFSMTLPDDFGDKTYAGKTVEVAVRPHRVEHLKLPEMDAEFFKQFDEAQDEKAFREHVTKQLTQEEERRLEGEYQADLGAQIKKAYSFDVPEELVNRHQSEVEKNVKAQNPGLDGKALEKKLEEEQENLRAEYRLRYALDKYAKENGVTVDNQEVMQRFTMQAYMMRQNPKDLINTEYGEMLLAQINEDMLDQKTLAFMVGQLTGKGGGEEKAAKKPPKGE